MAHPASYSLAIPAVEAHSTTEPRRIPWYVWCCAAAVMSSAVGGVWDISWHESIGRDSFWTAPHVLIYLCGVLAGLACGYLILSTTFQDKSPLRAASVTMWGFRGPLGAFICAWGGVAMITSAPFDNWWHGAYGLDVKIISPPHILLALGMTAIRFGTLVIVLAEMQRAQGEFRANLERMLFYSFLFLMAMTVGIAQEMTNRVFMHGAKFYLVVMMGAPIWMAAVSRVAKSRWAASIVTGMYMALHLCFVWILPLIPAEPKLGPVYQKVTHLVAPEFPLLLIVPAIVFDLVRPHVGTLSRWTQAAILGSACLVSFMAVQWPFADFLMSPASRNRFFATDEFPYFMPSTSHWVRSVYFPTEHTSGEYWMRMALALAVAVVTTHIGLSWGEWMKRLRR
jgi:hypothetical protein